MYLYEDLDFVCRIGTRDSGKNKRTPGTLLKLLTLFAEDSI